MNPTVTYPEGTGEYRMMNRLIELKSMLTNCLFCFSLVRVLASFLCDVFLLHSFDDEGVVRYVKARGVSLLVLLSEVLHHVFWTLSQLSAQLAS